METKRQQQDTALVALSTKTNLDSHFGDHDEPEEENYDQLLETNMEQREIGFQLLKSVAEIISE